MNVYFAWGRTVNGEFIIDRPNLELNVNTADELVKLRRKLRPDLVATYGYWSDAYTSGCDMAAAFYRGALADPELSPIVQDALLAQRREDSTRPAKCRAFLHGGKP